MGTTTWSIYPGKCRSARWKAISLITLADPSIVLRLGVVAAMVSDETAVVNPKQVFITRPYLPDTGQFRNIVYAGKIIPI